MKKILVFQHIKREHPSLVAEYAAERGITLDIIPLYDTHTIPKVSDYDALVVLGGSMGVYEEYPGKVDELSAISAHIGTVPMLGICLGAQLLAHALGAKVYPYFKEGKRCKEIGYYDVQLTPEGVQSPLFQGFAHTFPVLQWHGDTFDMPEGAALLVTDATCPHQAFSWKNAYGVQFHVEATPEIVSDWLHEDREWASADFSLNDRAIAERAQLLAPAMHEQCYRLMDNFLSV
ncbi:type 1 glutamine amidotransferase [Patescibacteria group bacterium]|nr:type 1 glutamine amidotransferase [Patescibacteria group bacterium]